MDNWRRRKTEKNKTEQSLSVQKNTLKEFKHVINYHDQYKQYKKLWQETKQIESSLTQNNINNNSSLSIETEKKGNLYFEKFLVF